MGSAKTFPVGPRLFPLLRDCDSSPDGFRAGRREEALSSERVCPEGGTFSGRGGGRLPFEFDGLSAGLSRERSSYKKKKKICPALVCTAQETELVMLDTSSLLRGHGTYK